MLDIFRYLPALVVEQELLSRRLLEAHLLLLGFTRVDGAEDVAAASHLLSQSEYGLIFVDLKLSKVSGLESIDYPWRRRQSRSSLLIAMGEDRIRSRATAIHAGADAFLGRPTSPGALDNMLVELLMSRTAWKTKIVPLPKRSAAAPRRSRLRYGPEA